MTIRNMIRFGEMLLGGLLSIMLFLFYFFWPETLSFVWWIPTIVPMYASCYALFSIIGRFLLDPFATSVLTAKIALIPMLMMIVDIFLYFILLWLIEEGFYLKRSNKFVAAAFNTVDDDDVVAEKARVQ